jgi:hypothetical protein
MAEDFGELASVPRLRAGDLDFECALHREVARATAKPSRAVRLAKMRRDDARCGKAERHGSEAPASPP